MVPFIHPFWLSLSMGAGYCPRTHRSQDPQGDNGTRASIANIKSASWFWISDFGLTMTSHTLPWTHKWHVISHPHWWVVRCLIWDIFEVKLTFDMLTVRGQQHSFSTLERVFLWKCQSVWDRKCLDLRGNRTPNLRRYWYGLIGLFISPVWLSLS